MFLDGKLFIFPAVREHWTDVGGMMPGSHSSLSIDISREEIRIPPFKISVRGVFNNAAMTLLFTHMCVAPEREEDFWRRLQR